MACHLADPTACSHLDWLACQLDAGIVLVGSDRKAACDLARARSPTARYRWRIAAHAVDRAGPGRTPPLERRQCRYVRARTCCPGGGLIHMVGADSSWTFLVERDHAKGRPSGHRHRPVCACAPPDLYRTHRCDTGDGCSGRDGDCHSRCGADRLWLVGKSKGGRRLSHLRARPERIRFLPPPGSDADTLPPSPVVAASASGQQSKARRGSRL